KNSFSTRALAHPVLPTTPISSTQFRCFFPKKPATPHPPYPAEPVFCANISVNNININSLHFKSIYQLVTANRPFCHFLASKIALSAQNIRIFISFAATSTHLARTQTLFHNLEALYPIPC
ncbi:MAG: hypothetical protein ABR907_16920, partial [Terracidiphilus sp.]